MNNFFDNYTKKTTGEPPKPEQKPEQRRPEQPKQQRQPEPPRQNVVRPSAQTGAQNSHASYDNSDSRLGVPVQNEHVGSNMPVQNMQTERSVQARQTADDMNFEQRSTFKAPEPKIATTNSKKPTPLLYGLIAGGVVIVAVVVTILLLSGGGSVTLPDMTGWTKTNVDLWASENETIVRYVETFSDEIPENTVMSQSPAANESLPAGTFLEISLSVGPDLSIMVTLPDIMNMSRSEVEDWAEQNHMTKLRITSEYSETVELGKVIEFTVNDETVVGTEVRRDTPVYVIFSNGSENTGPVTLPDFTTMSVEDAQEFADEKNIILEISHEYDDEIPKDTIMSQDIDAEEVIQGGDTVKLVVSLGKKIIVPNFGQYDREIAMSMASQLGIMTTVEERYSGSSEGRLISQSISSGTLYEEGDIVKLVYSLGNEFILSSYVGQSEDALKTWAAEVNDLGASIKISSKYTESSQPRGSILSQDKENTTIGISTTIYIVVSEGAIVYVPDFVTVAGLTYADAITREKAIAMCDEVGIVPIFEAVSQAGRLPGEVWYQSIEPGIQVDQGDTITLKYVPVDESFEVPDFTGMTKMEIDLAEYGYMFELVYEENGGDVSIDPVFSQSLRAGSVVAPGTKITLTLSYEEPIPEPEPEEPTE